ncbi:MAG: lyase family protein, partial [Solirubrobacteraceae bacterium]
MTSDGALLGGVYGRGAVAVQVSDDAFVQAMLDVEAALARACAAEGLIPSSSAEQIVAACSLARLDLGGLADETAAGATPVIGLVRALRVAVGADARAHVHLGATSQDVVDTALMLVARRALAPLLRDARAAAD